MFKFPSNILKAFNEADKGQLIQIGWKYKNRSRGSAIEDVPFFTSPCGKFIIKYGLLMTDCVPTFALPSKIRKADRRFRYWILQPKADRSESARKQAWEHFKPIAPIFFGLDIHRGNVAFFENAPVLIDW